MLLVFLLYALWASVFTVAKEAVMYADPFFIVGSRMLMAGCCMLAYAAWKYPHALKLSLPSLKRVLLLGLLNIYITNILELWGLQYLTSFKTCFLYSLSPFLSAFLSYLLLNDRMSARKWLGLLVGFAGFIPILILQNPEEEISGQFGVLSWAELAVLGAVFASVLGWILLKQLVASSPPIIANGYSMLFGGLLATIHSFFAESWTPIPVQDYSIWIQTTLFLIIVSNFLGYNLYGFLLKKFSPTFMAFAGLSTPLFTAFFGWIFHDEVVTLPFFISLGIVFLGLLIFYFEELKTIEREKEKIEIPEKAEEVLVPRSAT